MTTETFEAFVARRFKDGKLYHGAHSPDGMACLHEAVNVYQGKDWSDRTDGTIDLRGLNDARWSSDDVRTTHMLPLGALILDWPSWSEKQRQAFAKQVAEQTIRRVVPIALRAAGERLPSHRAALEAAAQRCADVGTESAASAARSAAWLAAEAAASAWSAADEPLIAICAIFREAYEAIR